MAMSVISRTSRAAPAAAVALGVLTLAAGLANVPLDILTHQEGAGGPAGDVLFTALVIVPAAGVSTLLAARRPRNPLGWILFAIFLISAAPVGLYAVLDYDPSRDAAARLAGLFAGVVVLATVVLPFKGPVTVAASTLFVAALFNPLRRRVQHAVDRRFNRARYNAEAVVAAFTGRLRQTVDLETVRGDLVDMVHEAIQPAHVSVWLTGDRDLDPRG